MKVVILRGLPGSGKSTWASKQPGAVICSADDYFIMPDGQYLFNRGLIGKAHEDCHRKFTLAIGQRRPLIIVDNTNVTTREYRRYALAAGSLGYDIEIRVFTGEFGNIHDVHAETIKRMDDLWQFTPLVYQHVTRFNDEQEK